MPDVCIYMIIRVSSCSSTNRLESAAMAYPNLTSHTPLGKQVGRRVSVCLIRLNSGDRKKTSRFISTAGVSIRETPCGMGTTDALLLSSSLAMNRHGRLQDVVAEQMDSI